MNPLVLRLLRLFISTPPRTGERRHGRREITIAGRAAALLVLSAASYLGAHSGMTELRREVDELKIAVRRIEVGLIKRGLAGPEEDGAVPVQSPWSWAPAPVQARISEPIR